MRQQPTTRNNSTVKTAIRGSNKPYQITRYADSKPRKR